MNKKLLFPLSILGFVLIIEYILYVVLFSVPILTQTKDIFEYVLVAGHFELTKPFLGTILTFMNISIYSEKETWGEKIIKNISISIYFLLTVNFFIISSTYFILRILPSFRLSYQVLTSAFGSIVYFVYALVYLYLFLIIVYYRKTQKRSIL